jgi:hypothetical protein
MIPQSIQKLLVEARIIPDAKATAFINPEFTGLVFPVGSRAYDTKEHQFSGKYSDYDFIVPGIHRLKAEALLKSMGYYLQDGGYFNGIKYIDDGKPINLIYAPEPELKLWITATAMIKEAIASGNIDIIHGLQTKPGRIIILQGIVNTLRSVEACGSAIKKAAPPFGARFVFSDKAAAAPDFGLEPELEPDPGDIF